MQLELYIKTRIFHVYKNHYFLLNENPAVTNSKVQLAKLLLKSIIKNITGKYVCIRVYKNKFSSSTLRLLNNSRTDQSDYIRKDIKHFATCILTYVVENQLQLFFSISLHVTRIHMGNCSTMLLDTPVSRYGGFILSLRWFTGEKIRVFGKNITFQFLC